MVLSKKLIRWWEVSIFLKLQQVPIIWKLHWVEYNSWSNYKLFQDFTINNFKLEKKLLTSLKEKLLLFV